MKKIQGKLILVQVSMKFKLQARVKNKIPVCKTKDQSTIFNNHHMRWSLHEKNQLTLVLKLKFTSPDKFCDQFVVTIKDL